MLTVDLRPYQDPAVEKFLTRGNLLLTMEMGVGKTITALGAAEELLGTGEVTSVLIVAPKSLVREWAKAIATVTDVETRLVRMKGARVPYPTEQWCVVIDGTPAKKKRLLDQVSRRPPNYIITSYDTAAKNTRLFNRLVQMVVIDEATVLKSFTAVRTKNLLKLRVPFRLALTGTPVENKPEESWAIMRWVDPDLLGNWRDFEDSFIRRNTFGRPVRYPNLHILHCKLGCASYRKRRIDPDVAPYMPIVDHQRWLVDLDAATEKVYRRIMADLATELELVGEGAHFDPEAYYGGMDENSAAGKVMAIHQAAQMLLDHPELVRSSQSRYAAEIAPQVAHLETSPKLSELVHRVSDILAWEGTKVIVVTRYRSMLSLFEQVFDSVPKVRFDGQMSSTARAAAVEAFEADPEVRLFVMSHAGAYGLDLPAATHLIHYDPPRSAGQYEQISARHVRASSTHTSVVVADLMVDHTIEKRTYDQLEHKTRIARAIVDGLGVDADGGLNNDVDSLTKHVRTTLANDVFTTA